MYTYSHKDTISICTQNIDENDRLIVGSQTQFCVCIFVTFVYFAFRLAFLTQFNARMYHFLHLSPIY